MKLWKSLRDRFTREKRQKSSGSATPESNWPYLGKMMFYNKYTRPRKTYTTGLSKADVESGPSSSCSSGSVWSTMEALLSPSEYEATEAITKMEPPEPDVDVEDIPVTVTTSKDRDYRNNGSIQTSDDESFNDNASVASNFSEVRSTDEGTEEVDEVTQQEAFEEKLSEAIDGLTQKSAQGRCNCLEAICKALVKKYIPTYVLDRKLTLCDGIERCLKKGKSVEQAHAAELAILLCVQLGALQACEEVCQLLRPVLLQTANDKTVSPATRGKCCTAVSLVAFLAGGEMGDVLHLMHQFETIFAGSYLKGDGSVPNISADLAILHSSALSAWTLLFTLMSPGDVYSMLDNSVTFTPSLTQLAELLKSGHLDVRLSAGEAVAAIFELGCEYQDDFGENLKDDLVEVLRQLATDSHKYRAKKDRKQQRATFREVLHYIESGDVPELQIKFGQECLILDSWVRRKQYDSLCYVLGPGINIHLSENDLLRDIFQLGTKILINDLSLQRQSKLERHLVNAAAFKARTISRGKNRDKRSDF